MCWIFYSIISNRPVHVQCFLRHVYNSLRCLHTIGCCLTENWNHQAYDVIIFLQCHMILMTDKKNIVNAYWLMWTKAACELLISLELHKYIIYKAKYAICHRNIMSWLCVCPSSHKMHQYILSCLTHPHDQVKLRPLTHITTRAICLSLTPLSIKSYPKSVYGMAYFQAFVWEQQCFNLIVVHSYMFGYKRTFQLYTSEEGSFCWKKLLSSWCCWSLQLLFAKFTIGNGKIIVGIFFQGCLVMLPITQ